jgi:sugar-specific transcriptional regulator TrmB
MIHDESVNQTLMKLGLTALQTKIYLTVIELQESEANNISKYSNVARPDVYRVMPTLEKMGLVEKIIASPTRYRATPIKETCNILLQKKKREFADINLETELLIKNVSVKKSIDEIDFSKEEFKLISSKSLLLKRLEIENSTIKNSINCVGDWKVVRGLMFNHLEIYERALNRGVKIRILTEKGNNFESAHKKILLKLNNHPLFKIKNVAPPISIRMAIYDMKKAHMCINSYSDSDITPSLWSNNPQFVKLIAAYFEEMWNKSEDPM